jgi:hypothetical protein
MAQIMKINGNPESIASFLIRGSIRATRREFAALVDYAMQDNTRDEIAAIAAHMPLELKELLPRRYLH